VYRDLDKIEQEVDLLKKQGSGSEEFEEYLRHLELIIEMCKDIRQACHYDVRKVFQASAEALETQMEFIRKNEIRINNQNEKAIKQLGQITQKKKVLVNDLRTLIT